MSGRAKRRRDAAERFSQRYGLPLGEAARIVERNVIGADLGANGYTTVAQAKLMARHLDLGPAKLLLDIGSGRGWPALYFAEITSCRVVLSDVPHSALRKAQATAGDRGIEPFVSIVRSSGTAPPFAPGVFDAVSHTDTL